MQLTILMLCVCVCVCVCMSFVGLCVTEILYLCHTPMFTCANVHFT